jgi:glycosyltransferase involved in cell wall biosynthesis
MFNNLYPPVRSGSSHFTSMLASMLAERGHEVTVITAQLPGTAEREQVDGVDIVRLPCFVLPRLEVAHRCETLSWTISPSNVRRLERFCREQQFDLLHQHGQIFDLALVSAYLAYRLKMPLVDTIHTPVHHTTPPYRQLLPFLDRTLVKHLIARRADMLVAPDQTIVDYIRERYAHPHVDYIPYGVDPIVADPARGAEIRRRLNLGDRPIILSVGHVHNLRDRCDLVAAMPHVLRAVPDAHLLVVGSVMTQKPLTLARQLGIESHVTFEGSVSHDHIGDYFAAATVEAHWLSVSLGLGIAAMEAMSVGLPIVTSYTEDALGDDLLSDGENIMLVDRTTPASIADPLIRLLTDRGLRERIGRAGQAVIGRHFSWPTVTTRMERSYERLLDSLGRRPAEAAGSAPRTRGSRPRLVPQPPSATERR